MIVVVGDELVVVHASYYHQDEDHQEDQKEEVDIGYHLVPIGHLILKIKFKVNSKNTITIRSKTLKTIITFKGS